MVLFDSYCSVNGAYNFSSENIAHPDICSSWRVRMSLKVQATLMTSHLTFSSVEFFLPPLALYTLPIKCFLSFICPFLTLPSIPFFFYFSFLCPHPLPLSLSLYLCLSISTIISCIPDHKRLYFWVSHGQSFYTWLPEVTGHLLDNWFSSCTMSWSNLLYQGNRVKWYEA